MNIKALTARVQKAIAQNPKAFDGWDKKTLEKLEKDPVKAMELLREALETREF